MIPGITYKQFACGHRLEENSFKMRYKQDGKWTHLSVCPICKTPEALFQHMTKICLECGQVVESKRGRRLSPYCPKCYIRHYNHHRRPVPKRKTPELYYQAGQRIKKPKRLVTKVWCKHRCDCLPMGHNSHLHCGGCRKYEREDIPTMVYDRRDHDPFEWAHGEAI
jgi:hypothetical protein